MIWHNSTAEQTIFELGSDASSGLTSNDAELRLKEYGRNELTYKKQTSLAKHLLSSLNNFVCIFLIIVAIVNLILAFAMNLNNKSDDLVIIAIAIIGTLLTSFFKYLSEMTLKKVESDSSTSVTVIRDGTEMTVNSSELVPGDIMMVKTGDYIKADGRLIDSYALTCDESMVSGDLAPSEKIHDILFDDITPLVNRHNMVYSGSVVLNGRGTVIVTETGLSTEVGMHKDITQQLEESETPLATKLTKIKRIASVITLISAIAVFFFGIISNFSNTNVSFAVTVSSNLLLALSVYFSVACDLIPSLLLFSKACAIHRLKNKGVALHSNAIAEKLKDVTVICTDKTGVLTTENLSVVKVFNGADTIDLKFNAEDESVAALLKLALICSNFARDEHGERHTNNIERSIETACMQYVGMSKTDIDGLYPKIAELPFDSDRMLMTTVTAINGTPVSITKGAPEVVFCRCSNINSNVIENTANAFAKEGLKVIAVAIKQLSEIPANPNSDDLENDLTFVGILGIEDNISNKAAYLCKECAQYGIRTIMVTGDHIDTAVAISLKAGIISDESEAISGEALAELDEAKLAECISRYSVFARITPDDKLRIVTALKSNGEKVLITGDSVNDTPALVEADFGCALGKTASDIVKDSADIVINDNHFSSIILAIKESTKIYINTKKALLHLFSVGISVLLLAVFGLLIFGSSPLMSAALIFQSVFVIAFPLYSIFADNAKKEIDLSAKGNKFFDKFSLIRALVPSLLTVVLALIAYGINLSIGVMSASGAAFTVLSFGEIFQAICILSSGTLLSKKLLHQKTGLIICAVTLLFFILFVLTPIGATLSISNFGASGWLLSVIVAIGVTMINEVLKHTKMYIIK